MTNFFIHSREESIYPASENNYNPDSFYPEYPWNANDISPERNHVYEMVRNCLIGLRLDEKNINSKDWNPFGDFIKQGDTVLIKPNWVMHYNKNKHTTENSMECLITHPSIVRPIIDYCLIALKDTGKILIGDSPMQGCDLDILLEKSGYNNVFGFYARHSKRLFPIDFRQYSTLVDKNKVLTGKKYNPGEGILVELDGASRFNTKEGITNKYRVSDYNEDITNSFHNNGQHGYLISKDVLSADVVINLCKPKCHRLAGMTAAIKNFVGITFDKACLPHRTAGSKHHGGDEYLNPSMLKKLIAWTLRRKMYFEEHKMLRLSLAMRYMYGLLYYTMRWFSKDKFLVGSWYGNDTIWRTVLDLYHILLYADKVGKVREGRQRRVFSLADMIISGERNGPVSPEPKKLGVLIAGFDAVVMDRLICNLMGFDPSKVPSVHNAVSDSKLNEFDEKKYKFYSNLKEFDDKSIDELRFPVKWRFKPYDTWKGFIEKAE